MGETSSKPANPKLTSVVVTGVAGFIGSHLAESLLSQGVSVIGIDSFDSFYPRTLKEKNLESVRESAAHSKAKFTFLEQPLATVEKMAAPAPIDVIFHLAARAGVSPSLTQVRDYTDANVGGTISILEMAKKWNCPNLVLASSSSVYGSGTPLPFREEHSGSVLLSPYAVTKRCAEIYAGTYGYLWGLKIANLRLFTVFGPRQRPDLAIQKFFHAILNGTPIELFDKDRSARDYTFVSDVVEGFRRAGEWVRANANPGLETFNIGSGSPIALTDLIQRMETIVGKPAVKQAGRPRTFDMEKTWADLTKSRTTLGYSPRMNFDEGLKAQFEWITGAKGARKNAA